MHAIPSIITERVDDIPLLREPMQQMQLPAVLDQHLPAHGHWHGLSLGWGAPLGRSAILSRGDHRLVQVDPGVGTRLWRLRTATGQGGARLDLPADRLAIVLWRLRDDTRWSAWASALHQPTVRVYDLVPNRVHSDSTRARAYVRVPEAGRLQWGPSQAQRPALPHVKVRQAVRAPWALPVATAVGSGARADAPLSSPCSARVQASCGRRGLW